MRFVPTAFILIFFPLALQARLADTQVQLLTRYGTLVTPPPEFTAPILPGSTELIFTKDGWWIRCALLLARDGESYVVREDLSYLRPGPISNSDLSKLAAQERPGAVWVKNSNGQPQTTNDGTVATLSKDGMTVRFDLPQARAYEATLPAPSAPPLAPASQIIHSPIPQSFATPHLAPDLSAPQQPPVAPPTSPTKPSSAWGLLVLAAIVAGLAGGQKKRKKRKTKENSSRARIDWPVVEQSTQKRTVKDLSWEEFELVVGEIYRRQGYEVELLAGTGSDGGIDLVLHKDSERVLVQCKQWNKSTVSVREIREFYGTLTHDGAARGIFVNAGEYSRDARDFAVGKPIEMIDGAILKLMIANAEVGTAEDLLNVSQWAPAFYLRARLMAPGCPFCKGPMTLRKTSTPFWGCRTYPRCSGKRDIREHLAAQDVEALCAVEALRASSSQTPHI